MQVILTDYRDCTDLFKSIEVAAVPKQGEFIKIKAYTDGGFTHHPIMYYIVRRVTYFNNDIYLVVEEWDINQDMSVSESKKDEFS